MSKEKKKSMTPKVRFPEFREAWVTKDLGEIAVLINDKAGTNSYTLMSITAGVGLVTQIEKFGREIAGESYKNYYVIKKGDFAYNKSSTKQHPEGQIAMLEDEEIAAVPNSIFTCFRVDDKLVSPFFLKYPFINNIHGEWLRKFIEVGARAHGALSVDTKDLFATPIHFPTKPEQQKIAATLTSLDDLITAQSEKIKALQAHKKGLMQQLFPAEGERVPRVRFKEFEGSGEWEEKRIEDLAIRGSGHTPNRREPIYYNGGIKWVSLADSNKLDKGYIYETQTEISKDGLKNSSAVLHPAGTVIVSRDAGVGKSAILHSEMAVSQHFITWTCDKSKLSNWFLYYFLQVIKPKLERIASGSTIKTIGLPFFKEICITIPSILEQQKIAATLTSLDDLITTQHEKLEALKMQKKGLMQQLFPNPNDEAI